MKAQTSAAAAMVRVVLRAFMEFSFRDAVFGALSVPHGEPPDNGRWSRTGRDLRPFLAAVVRGVDRGEVYVSPSLAAGILVALTHGRPTDPLGESTEKEREILKLVGEGLTNRAIGERIHLSEKTVKHYISNILQKLQVRSRVEAALLAARSK